MRSRTISTITLRRSQLVAHHQTEEPPRRNCTVALSANLPRRRRIRDQAQAERSCRDEAPPPGSPGPSASLGAARPCQHAVCSRWFVDETYVKVSGSWWHVYRAVDEQGQVIDVFVSKKRDTQAAVRFFSSAIGVHGAPTEVTTDRSPTLARAITGLLPLALHDTTQYANNRVEADHGRLKARLRSMRGLKRDRTASVIMRGHAFVQNVRRGHYELGVDALPGMVLAAAFHELAMAI